MNNSETYFSVFLAVIVLFISPTFSYGRTIFVDKDATSGGNSGISWPDAYLELQDALADASSSGGEIIEIRVAQGTYTPADPNGDRNATFQLINGVTLKGGYAGINEPDPNARDYVSYETILSGDLNNNLPNTENSYHVVTASNTDSSAVLNGFIITRGNAGIDRDNDPDKGGGLYSENGDFRPTTLQLPLNSFNRTVPVTKRCKLLT